MPDQNKVEDIHENVQRISCDIESLNENFEGWDLVEDRKQSYCSSTSDCSHSSVVFENEYAVNNKDLIHSPRRRSFRLTSPKTTPSDSTHFHPLGLSSDTNSEHDSLHYSSSSVESAVRQQSTSHDIVSSRRNSSDQSNSSLRYSSSSAESIFLQSKSNDAVFPLRSPSDQSSLRYSSSSSGSMNPKSEVSSSDQNSLRYSSSSSGSMNPKSEVSSSDQNSLRYSSSSSGSNIPKSEMSSVHFSDITSDRRTNSAQSSLLRYSSSSAESSLENPVRPVLNDEISGRYFSSSIESSSSSSNSESFSLTSSSASERSRSTKKISAIQYACQKGNLAYLKALLERDPPDIALDQSGSHGQSPLHVAIRKNYYAIAEELCNLPIVDEMLLLTDSQGNTPLHMAASANVHFVKLLLKYKANPNIKNSQKLTPLGIYVLKSKNEKPRICHELLKSGADPNADYGTHSILHEAVDRNLPIVAKLLIQYGGRLDLIDADGKMVFEKIKPSALGYLLDGIQHPPTWVSSSMRNKCMLCSTKFSIKVRRHHCRYCGRICCFECASLFVEMHMFPKFFPGRITNGAKAIRDPQRVCKTCFNVFKRRGAFRGTEGKKTAYTGFMTRVVGIEWDDMRHTKVENETISEI